MKYNYHSNDLPLIESLTCHCDNQTYIIERYQSNTGQPIKIQLNGVYVQNTKGTTEELARKLGINLPSGNTQFKGRKLMEVLKARQS